MNIAGRVLFNPNSSANPNDALNYGLASVPVVLQIQGDTTALGATTGAGVVALTDASGGFVFTDVPAGSFRVIEAWGQSGATASTVSYNTAGSITVVPADPPASAVPNPPGNTNRINSLSPNTLFVTVASADVTDLVFLDAPNNERALEINNYVWIGENLFRGADYGTIGFLPNGSGVQTSPYLPPYQLESSFNYAQYGPIYVPVDGDYSISNTIVNTNFNSWFNLSDHTTGDETGRMLIVNGDYPGVTVYAETITVLPNTRYVFSLWICNVDSNPTEIPPLLGVRVTAANGDILFNQDLAGDLTAINIPSWVQIGDTVNSGTNTTLTVEFISEGASGNGNDFIIDDIALYQLQPAATAELGKTVSAGTASGGDVLSYSLTLANPGPAAIMEASVQDLIPAYTTLVPGSLYVDGVNVADSELANGLNVGTMAVGESVTVNFQVLVASEAPAGTVLQNTASLTYNSLDESGQIITTTGSSNTVETVVEGGPAPTPVLPDYGHYGNPCPSCAGYGGLIPLVDFTTDGSNITHPAGGTELTLQAGAYLVIYRTTARCLGCTDPLGSNLRLGLLLNGMPYPSGTASTCVPAGGSADLGGTAILRAKAGDILSLANLTEAAVSFSDTALSIVRIV